MGNPRLRWPSFWAERQRSFARLGAARGRKGMHTVWELRTLPGDSPKDQERRKSFSDRIEALKEYDRVMHEGPAWVELWELEEGKEPQRLRRD
jgi:hypothetical protein